MQDTPAQIAAKRDAFNKAVTAEKVGEAAVDRLLAKKKLALQSADKIDKQLTEAKKKKDGVKINRLEQQLLVANNIAKSFDQQATELEALNRRTLVETRKNAQGKLSQNG